VIFAAGLAALAAAYVACVDEVAGLFVDDGWYVLLGRALATGHGFTLINAPIPGVLPFYPPGFPALLAGVFLIAPEFPANVWLLKGVSIVALLAGALLVRHHFVRDRGTSPGIASCLGLLAAANPMMHFLITSAVMSEAFFLCVQMAAIVAVESYTRAGVQQRGRAVDAVVPGLLLAATALVRSIGLTLAVAAVLAVLLRGGKQRAALLAAAVAVFLAPWQIYSALHAPTERQQAVINDAIAWPYVEHFKWRRAGHAEFGRETVADLPDRLLDNALRLTSSTMGSVLANPLLERLHRPRGRFTYASALSLGCAALTLLGLVAAIRTGPTVAELYVVATIAVLLAFRFDADRYLLPLVPLLAFHAGTGVAVVIGSVLRAARVAAPRAARHAARGRAVLLGALLLVNAAGLARDVVDARGVAPGRRSGWQHSFAENLQLLAWVRSRLPRDVVLATHNPAMVHLYTGNPTVGSWEPQTNAANWRAADARFWVDNTVAEYRFPNFERSGLEPLVLTPKLRLGVYRIPAPARAPG
jgi:hypothetical protein